MKQPYDHKEIIVVNDGSKDNLDEVIKKIRHKNLKYISYENNKGQNFARNIGIDSTNAEIVTILDSDDQDYGNNLDFIINYFKNNPDISTVFTPVISKKNSNIISNINKCNKKMGFLEMIDGTYSGEYQAFFRRNKLPKKFFREDLCIKRSCTTLTFLKFFSKETFTILSTVTKLYNDEHKDRLGNKKKIQEDSNELSKCYDLIVKEFGNEILLKSISFYNNLIIKISYYKLLSKGRYESIKTLKNLKFHYSLFYLLPLILLCTFLGSKMVRVLRSIF